jgi:cyclin-dependent kinase 12/13
MDKSKATKKEQKKSSRRSSKTSPSQQKIVEYSDVSSNELSTPEQGEIPSDGLSVVSEEEITPGPATNERSMHHSSIYEPIDDDDDELEKIMDADRFSDSMSDSNKKRKKTKKKLKKGKKSKKKKKRRRHSTDSVEEISDDEILGSLSSRQSKKNDEPGTPPLDQVSYTPKHKYKASSPSNYCHINDSPNSIVSDEKKEYSSPHTPPMPKKVIEESSKGRNSSISSSTSNKVSSKRRRVSPERSSKDYRVRGGRSRSPYEYESRRYVERDRSPYRQRDRSPYPKYRERRRRSR